MRVGEIQKKLEAVLNSSNQIVMDAETIYAGQAYQINNYGALVSAFDILEGQSWNTADSSNVQKVIDEVGRDARVAQISAEDYQVFEAYITALNQLLPVYVSVINSLTEEQDSKVINVKLPEDITTMKELASINDKIYGVLKQFKQDGEVEFQGFDKGTDWLILLLAGEITFPLFLGCLDAARKYLEARETWFKSEKARIEFEAAAKSFKQEATDEKFEVYRQGVIDGQLAKDVEKVLESLPDTNGKTKPERESNVIMATQSLIEVMGEGVEFHLSLNPPEYAKETAGRLEIDYKKLKALNAPVKETKTLTDGKTKPETKEPPKG